MVSAVLGMGSLSSCKSVMQETAGVVEVNGISLAYIVEGEGKPVILLHGNGGSHKDLETTTHQLAKAGYKVYAIDSRGQGENKPLSEYHYKDMAEDVYQFINKLGIVKPAVFGWSDGGNNALLLELMHPNTCSLMATSGANLFPKGLLPEEYENMVKEKNLSPLLKMMIDEPDMTFEDMKNIQVPVLVMAGENDAIQRSHTEQIASNIPNGKVMIIPGEDHISYILHNKKVGKILLKYFKENGY